MPDLTHVVKRWFEITIKKEYVDGQPETYHCALDGPAGTITVTRLIDGQPSGDPLVLQLSDDDTDPVYEEFGPYSYTILGEEYEGINESDLH